MPDPNTDQRPVPLPALGPPRPWGMDEKTFCILLHLSMLIPSVGYIITLVMWLVGKEQSPRVDAHGRAAVNWLLSAIIYCVVSIPLMLLGLGILTLFATVICHYVFAIIAAVKASNGEVWDYPLSIPFFGRGRDVVARGGPATPPPGGWEPHPGSDF